jgi:hypothetical protein
MAAELSSEGADRHGEFAPRENEGRQKQYGQPSAEVPSEEKFEM